MNARKAKALRRQARQYTPHLPEHDYTETAITRLGECTRGAYQALKRQRFNDNR